MTLAELERAAASFEADTPAAVPDGAVRRAYLALVGSRLIADSDANYLLFALAFRAGAKYAVRDRKAARDGG